MTGVLHNTINIITDECFPWRKRKIRSTDGPWIMDKIRHLIRNRKRKFCKYQSMLKGKEMKENRKIKIER